jgi:hypothetical protein
MAVTANTLALFGRILQLARKRLNETIPRPAPIKLLSLGYIDFIASKDDVAKVFGPHVADAVTIRGDSQSIAAWHGRQSSVIDADSLWRVLGFDPHYLDIAVIRGGEIVQDLNEPLAPELVGAFDFVIDSGTLEHCFNIAQAVANVAMAVRVGGVVHHGNPLVMINHGFYNFSPAFYHDFYGANGFKLIDMYAVEQPPGQVRLTRLDGVERIKFADPIEKVIQVLVQKVEQRPIVWPMQTKYVQSPDLTK